jgi:DNA-binding Lrp family transcriptional regulator
MKLDHIDEALLALAQGDLKVCARPYEEWAARLGIPVDEVISRLHALKERGIIREMKAILRHVKAGFKANAMVLWAVPADRVDELGSRIASAASVSHCYEREGFGRYNVFSMIHARSDDEVMEAVSAIAHATGIDDYQIFWSLTELKKSSMKYFRQEGVCDE